MLSLCNTNVLGVGSLTMALLQHSGATLFRLSKMSSVERHLQLYPSVFPVLSSYQLSQILCPRLGYKQGANIVNGLYLDNIHTT